jgi:hypothetical protein
MVYWTMLSETRQSGITYIFFGEIVGSDDDIGENSNLITTLLVNKCTKFVNIWLTVWKLNHNA